jgi:hypothetical protein
VPSHVANWFAIAERYHWTPAQVDELPEEFYEVLPELISGLSAAQDAEQRMANLRAQQAAQNPQGPGYPGSMAG